MLCQTASAACAGRVKLMICILKLEGHTSIRSKSLHHDALTGNSFLFAKHHLQIQSHPTFAPSHRGPGISAGQLDSDTL